VQIAPLRVPLSWTSSDQADHSFLHAEAHPAQSTRGHLLILRATPPHSQAIKGHEGAPAHRHFATVVNTINSGPHRTDQGVVFVDGRRQRTVPISEQHTLVGPIGTCYCVRLCHASNTGILVHVYDALQPKPTISHQKSGGCWQVCSCEDALPTRQSGFTVGCTPERAEGVLFVKKGPGPEAGGPFFDKQRSSAGPWGTPQHLECHSNCRGAFSASHRQTGAAEKRLQSAAWFWQPRT
jgi:hypothetical protein